MKGRGRVARGRGSSQVLLGIYFEREGLEARGP
jgi:hypothetical protein